MWRSWKKHYGYTASEQTGNLFFLLQILSDFVSCFGTVLPKTGTKGKSAREKNDVTIALISFFKEKVQISINKK